MSKSRPRYYGVMPEHYHPDDRQWIGEQMQVIPLHLRERACVGYSAVYVDAQARHAGMPYEHCRARFAANTRLREHVDKLRALPSVTSP